MKMTPEDRLLCLCTRQNLEAKQENEVVFICQNQRIDWEYVFTTADLHQVSPLVYLNLTRISSQELNIPSEVFSRFKKAQIHNILAKKRTRASLEKALALFDQKGIDVMVVKGEALNHLVYEQPWYTISYDIDLVIRIREEELDGPDREEILTLLDNDNKARDGFKEHIEYDFYEHHDITMNDILNVDWHRIWAEARKIEILGYPVFVMMPEDMLLSAAINSCRKRFFRLKSMCDLVSIIEKYPDLDWSTVILKAHEYRCNTILYTALVVTQATLGCALPAGILTELRVNPIRLSIINKLVSQLSQRLPLSDLYVQSENATFKRTLSWPRCLTYATYRLDLLGPKLWELYAAWRNPPPPVPA
jgi:hypothetical protein